VHQQTKFSLGLKSFAIIALISVAFVSAAAAAAPEVRIGGDLPVVPAAALPAAPSLASASELLTIAVVLKRDHQAEFERYLRAVYDPDSPQFHHFLTQAQLAERFGPSRADYDELRGYLEAQGMRLVAGSPSRLVLTVEGRRDAVERAFHLRLRDYRLGQRRFFANDRNPALPAALAAHVQSVAGLSDLASPARGPTPEKLAAAGPKAAPDFQLTQAVCLPGFSYINVPGNDLYSAIVRVYLNIFGVLTQGQNNPFGKVACGALGFALGASIATCDAMALSNPSIWCVAGSPCNEYYTGITGGKCGSLSGSAMREQPTQLELTPQAAPQSPQANPQKIGLLEFDSFNPSDVQNWLNLLGGSATFAQLSEVAVNGGVATPGAGEPEVLLDVDTVMALAPMPSTSYVVYEAPLSTPFETILNAMIADGDTVISNSWAECEDQVTESEAQAIDSVLQQAAGAGISVLNGAGDSGSTCLDGTPNTISVPADSPNGTAVGGTTPNVSTGLIYPGESWWNGTNETPPTGQGGFGVSAYFSAPSYQSGLSPSGQRSVPDVVTAADPSDGVEICEADAGGCPNGKIYGGTSLAAPEWAAYVADLNAMLGTNLGNLNAKLYPLANTSAFHDAAALNSDFAHVGLGSPDFLQLRAALAAVSPGAPSAGNSFAVGSGVNADGSAPADGKTNAIVQTILQDANGLPLAGRTIQITTTGSAVANTKTAQTDSDGNAVFTLTDLNAEAVTVTATDTTDGFSFSQQPQVNFATPPAVAAGLDVFPSEVNADGVTQGVIVVTLQDSLGRPTPGKTVQLSQTGGNSVITGPVPAVTDANGEIQFTAVDSNDETITYSAVDVTDGNLPFPQTGQIQFANAPLAGCSNTVTAAPGYIATPYVTGFQAQNYFYGDINFAGCPGVYGMAFDTAGDLYATDGYNGNLYKIPPGGGAADSSTLLTNLGQTATGLVFDHAGNLYVSRDATTGNFFTGAVMQIDPATGAVIQTVAANLTCPTALSVDPLSGDLFTDDSCSGAGSDNSALWRISGAPSSPTVSVYANLPMTPNANIAFAPGGNMYIWDTLQGAEVTGTNGPNPPVVTTIQGLAQSYLGMLAFGNQGNGDATYLIANIAGNTTVTPNVPPTVANFDLTASPPSVNFPIISNGGANNLIVGPDNCVYAAQGGTIWRITDSNGGCTYTGGTLSPSLALNPTSFSNNPTQGSPISVTASFHDTTVAAGTPVVFTVSGANPQSQQVLTDATGSASFTYIGAKIGTDTIVATGHAGTQALSSNPAVVNWNAGSHVTFLTLNASPTSLSYAVANTLSANLTDASASPTVPLAGETINFLVDGSQVCSGTTDINGNASCSYTPNSTVGVTLTADFAGSFGLNPASVSSSVNVVAAPVTGKLSVKPKKLKFGSVDLGTSKTKTVKVKNKGKDTKKKTVSPILIEMETSDNSAFVVTQSCTDDELEPKMKGVKANVCDVEVTFTPTVAEKYTGTLTITDNLEPDLMQTVTLSGTGKTPKTPK